MKLDSTNSVELTDHELDIFAGWLEGVRNFTTFIKLAKKLKISRFYFGAIKAKRMTTIPLSLISEVASRHKVMLATVVNTKYTGSAPLNMGDARNKKVKKPAPVKPPRLELLPAQQALSILTECLLITPDHRKILERLQQLLNLSRDGSAYAENLFHVLYTALPLWLNSGGSLSAFVDTARAVIDAKEKREAK